MKLVKITCILDSMVRRALRQEECRFLVWDAEPSCLSVTAVRMDQSRELGFSADHAKQLYLGTLITQKDLQNSHGAGDDRSDALRAAQDQD